MDEHKKYQHAEFARQILTHARRYEWSLHGLGMLRFYITQDLRIHVWDSRYRVSDVSAVHTYPWHLESTVLCGCIEQYRYSCHPGYDANGADNPKANYDQYLIHCADEGLEGLAAPVTLVPQWDYTNETGLEVIEAGDSYSQAADEIHLSLPQDGTMTLIRRQVANPHQPDRAFVYVPAGEEWVSAEARAAKSLEVRDIIDNALERWFR